MISQAATRAANACGSRRSLDVCLRFFTLRDHAGAGRTQPHTGRPASPEAIDV